MDLALHRGVDVNIAGARVHISSNGSVYSDITDTGLNVVCYLTIDQHIAPGGGDLLCGLPVLHNHVPYHLFF